jgi:hypothetical protein
MADEIAEGETHGTSNGASSSVDRFAASRAAFLAGEDASSDDAAKSPPNGAPKEDAKDDDSDLDDALDPDDVDTKDEDEDSDLDENDSEDKDKDGEDEDKNVDADTAKRLSQVRRTDKRLREQRDKEWAARDAEFETRVKDVEERWAPRIEKAERIERLMERAAIDPLALLQAANVPESAYEYVGQTLYTHSKAKDDPKAKAALAQLMRDRERDEEIANLKKWRDDREKTDKSREQQTAADREVDAFIGTVTKAASDKTPLAKTLLKNDPDSAREELQIVAYRLAKEQGRLPDAKAVMIAFEKHQRGKLRRLGIDPKSRGAAAALTDSKTTTTSKKSDKKIETGKPTEKTSDKPDDKKTNPRDAFISRKFD